MKSGKHSALLRRENRQGWLSVLPVLALELLVCAYPIGMVIVKSFTNWDGMFKSDPVGLRNYIRIFSDPKFWTLLKNTGVFLLTIPVQALIGMIIAVILNDRIPGWRFFRLVYYLPSIISMTVVGLLYKIMFSYSGPLNEVLRAIGLDALAIEWLNSGPSARFVVFLCLVWSNIGWPGSPGAHLDRCQPLPRDVLGRVQLHQGRRQHDVQDARRRVGPLRRALQLRRALLC